MTVAELRACRLAQALTAPGVYAVLRESIEAPEFLARSSGGCFKGKDPTVPVPVLEGAWVAESQVLYLGKAGHVDRGPSIRQRLTQYLDFGEGKPVGHWGGRYIWQLASSSGLLVAWRKTGSVEPRAAESALIAEFEALTGKFPFANLTK